MLIKKLRKNYSMSQICTCGIFQYTLDGFTVVRFMNGDVLQETFYASVIPV